MNYERHEIAALVEHYAAAKSLALQSVRQGLMVRLIDIDAALAKLSPTAFDTLTLVGRKQLTAEEAGLEIGVDESTIRRRYAKALDEVLRYMNQPSEAPDAQRTHGWWDWAADEDAPAAKVSRRRPGRPSSTEQALEERIVVLGCSGATEREIAEAESVPRSTVRSVLKRYGVQRRRGPRPKPTNWRLPPGGVYCVPDELIRAYRATMPAD